MPKSGEIGGACEFGRYGFQKSILIRDRNLVVFMDDFSCAPDFYKGL